MRIVVRWRTARSRLARFVTGSLAAHGALAVVVLIVMPILRPKPQTFDDAMVVALAGPLPGPPAAPAGASARPSAPPPAPAPAPPPKEAHTVREVPKPQPKATPAPKKKEETPSRATPAPSTAPGPPQEQESPAPPDAGQEKGSGSGSAAAGATGVTAVLGGGDASLGFYGATVKAALESAWIKPPLEDQGETYSATVMFVIARDGTVRDARISEPSGVPSLDRSVLRAVLEASPFPPIPPSWQGDSLPATMRFDLNPEGR